MREQSRELSFVHLLLLNASKASGSKIHIQEIAESQSSFQRVGGFVLVPVFGVPVGALTI